MPNMKCLWCGGRLVKCRGGYRCQEDDCGQFHPLPNAVRGPNG